MKIAKILSFKMNVIQVLKLEQTSLSSQVTIFSLQVMHYGKNILG